MYAWEAIQETIEYIEQNYEKEINIEQLATIAHLSQYYYQRLFYRLTQKTVNEYVKLRRLAKACQLLKSSQQRIIDIALACGFSDQSHLTRLFKEIYHMTPKEYRESDIHLDQFIKPNLSLQHIMIDVDSPLITQEMVLEIHHQVLEDDILFAGQSQLASMKDLGEPKINHLVEMWKVMEYEEGRVAVDILTPSANPEQFEYFVGIEVKREYTDKKMKIMPHGHYVVCSYEAENFESLVNEALYRASQYLYEVWLPYHHLQTDQLLVQKYFHPFQENCYIELWAKLSDEVA